MAAANPNTAVVLYGGSAFITEAWRDKVGAILAAWYPGMEGGHALAGILFGDDIPGGRLPCSWPVAVDQLPPFRRFARTATYGPLHGYRMHEARGTEPAFAFGYGLGYSEVEWSAPSAVRTENGATISVDLTDTGDVAAVEVVQVYVSERLGSHPDRLRTLRGFTKVRLDPGERRTVTVEIALPMEIDSVWVGSSSRSTDLTTVAVAAPPPVAPS